MPNGRLDCYTLLWQLELWLRKIVMALRNSTTEQELHGGSLNIIGLVLSFAGVIILFRYGMPFKVRTGGASHIILEQTDEAEVELEARYDKYGQGGLC